MPEIRISVGERTYTVACQPGEETHLQAASQVLNREAMDVVKSAKNIPEGQMLLMAGLMLADKMSGGNDREEYADHQLESLQEKLRASELKASQLSRELEAVSQGAAPVSSGETAEHALLEKMAVELERLADEMEAAST